MINSPTERGWRDQHPEPFKREEIVPSPLRGTREGNVEACAFSEERGALVGAGDRVIPSGSFDEVWFRLTTRGLTVPKSWDAPPIREGADEEKLHLRDRQLRGARPR